MKDAVELYGYSDKEGEGFTLLPTGNHRNQQRVIIEQGAGGHRCGKCKTPMRAFVQTFPTKEYTAWKINNTGQLQDKYQSEKIKTGAVVVYVWIFGGQGFRENRDWDNVEKCVGDLLVESEVLPMRETPDGLVPGGDDVRTIRGWRVHYLDKPEHAAMTGERPDKVKARLFVQLVPAHLIDPFKV